MRYFTNLFSPETFEPFSRGDRAVTGFTPQQSGRAKGLQVGDRFACYLIKLSRWVGILEVTGETYEDNTPLFRTDDDPYTVRIPVRPLVWLPKELAVPITVPEVWEKLSFTRGTGRDSYGWTGMIRSSMNRVSEPDGEFLLTLLKAQECGGRVYPVDEKRYWRLLNQSVRRKDDKVVTVATPDDEDGITPPDATIEAAPPESPRESIKMQALLARVGEAMGFRVWIPKADRAAVATEWEPRGGTLMTQLPLNYDDVTLATIEQIDVLWLRGRAIARAFEVEHTTAIYSGLLRMADLLALQPNMDIALHIVAPEERRDKVFRELRRPVFALLDKGPLAESCSYLSYAKVHELVALPHLRHLSDQILDEYSEVAE